MSAPACIDHRERVDPTRGDSAAGSNRRPAKGIFGARTNLSVPARRRGIIVYQLQDCVSIVTGAAGNVGAATAKLLLSSGARVALVERREDKLKSTYPDVGDNALFVTGIDVTDPESVARMTKEVCDQWGRVDVLINTVGSFRGGVRFDQEDLEEWDFLFRLNIKSALLTARAVAPIMIDNGGGRIINIGAAAGLKGEPNLSAYSASKSGVIRLTESISQELKIYGITANSVLPGIIDTPQNRAQQPDADTSTWVTPEQVAQVICFLASPLASGINQAAIPITGRG